MNYCQNFNLIFVIALCVCWCADASAGADVNHARSTVGRIRAEFTRAAVLHLRRCVHLENFGFHTPQTRSPGRSSACYVLTRYVDHLKITHMVVSMRYVLFTHLFSHLDVTFSFVLTTCKTFFSPW